MRVVSKTGLVPVYNLVSGRIHGVFPDIARAMIADGKAELHKIPDGVEYYEVPDREAPAQAASEPTPDKEIPPEFEKKHFLWQIKLAQEIFGYKKPPEGRQAAEYALELLRNEVQRRAAAVTPPN